MTSPPPTEQAPSPSRPRWSKEPWLAVGLVFAAVAAAAYHCGFLSVPIVDDAAISIAYGHTFFAGHGFRVTPSSQPVEGFSNLLWTLMLGLSRPLDAAPDTYAHTLGIVFGLLALPVFAAWGPVAGRRSPRLEDALGPWVAAASTTYATWISSGMETGLQTFLLALCGVLLLRELRTGTGAWVGLALGLLCLTRPEGLLYVVAAGLVWLCHQGLGRQWAGRQALGIAAWLVVLVGGWFVVRWVYFADWLPNTYYAKRLWSFDGPGYLRNYYTENGRLCLLAAAGLVLGLLGGAATGRQSALAALFLLAGGFFAYRNGDWMREWRFLAPLVPLLGVALAAGVAGTRERAALVGARGGRWHWGERGVVAVVVVAMLAVLGPWMKKSVMRAPGIKVHPELPYEFIANRLRVVQDQARALGQVHPLVAYPDLGGQSMVLREGEIIDVAGLGDYAMAHQSGNPAAMEDYLVSEGPPSFLDVHGPSRHLMGFRSLMTQFHALGEDRWQLNGLSATEDPRCPGGKSAALAPDRQALAKLFEQDIQEGAAERGLKRWRCVFAYKPRRELPERDELRRLSDLAEERGEALEKEGQLVPALRSYSLATLLDRGDAHLRRKTEALRARVFPAVAP
ncbi:hypothetical protein LZ198_36870 [Myxococcus sp. K15C18031901]|uniref:hypothetical protein n=1 Tax=Myxococcus dinghuensis TaxID=2906761 RepID=UPI0020A7DBD6|nr:hypothetical protein [Myxococcus dinghuensis]MCP3104452.1 hypothetical protein [Myxococcus dinghuensis]